MTTTTHIQTNIEAPAKYFFNQHEITVVYDRSDDVHMEFALSKCQGVTPTFEITSFQLKENPNLDVFQEHRLSMAEARLLRDLLTRPEVVAYLDAELM